MIENNDRTKREFLEEWTRAVNEHGGFGQWVWAVSGLSGSPADLVDILHSKNM